METAEMLRSETASADLFEILGTHHIEFYVGNAKQAAYFYRRTFGFELIGYAGPETGVRETASYVLKQGKIVLVLTTALVTDHPATRFVATHGDGVRDIALHVANAEEAFRITTARGATVIAEPHTIEDEFGKAVIATVATYGDTVHSFIQRDDSYSGIFLPRFRATPKDTIAKSIGLKHVDHIVGNMDWNQMDGMVEFYNKVFGFARFVSFDDTDISTEYSALRSTVVANSNRWIKFPINEPAVGKKKSQIEEYVVYNNGPGVQHIAMESADILYTVEQLRANGVELLETPDSYYDDLKERVGNIDEEIEILRRLRILVDRDDKGYMLQIFTKPLQDRPTLFIELIQRKGGESFGKGNFKALFESIEREQEKRGNL